MVTDTVGNVGSFSGSNGTVTVTGVNNNGTASTWSNSSSLYIGTQGVGSLTVSSGGKVTSPTVTLADLALATGTLNLNSSGVLETGSVTEGSGTGGGHINFDGGI